MPHEVFISLPLSQKEAGSYNSYLSVNIFFYKKLEVGCVVFINSEEHVVCVCCYFPVPPVLSTRFLSYLVKHQNNNTGNECASFIRNYWGPRLLWSHLDHLFRLMLDNPYLNPHIP